MPLPIVLQGEEFDPSGTTRKIVESAMSTPVELSAAPTTAGGQLPRSGNWGFFGNDLYINLSGQVRKFSGTLV